MSETNPALWRSGQGVSAPGVRSVSNSAIDELTNRLRSSAGSPTPGATQRVLLFSGARRYAIVALVALCILGAGFAGVRMWPTTGETARTLVSRVASTLPMIRNMLSVDPASTDEPVEPPSAPAPHRSAHTPRPEPPLVSRQRVAPAFTGPALLLERPPTPPVAPIETPEDLTVYSSADPEVAPPKPQLVAGPASTLGGRRALQDTLELLVSNDGTVEHAELHTRDPQMLDSMLLSRVKTWRFAPARRQGHAVAYHLFLVWDGSQFQPAVD
jgi:hypothetical protein